MILRRVEAHSTIDVDDARQKHRAGDA